MKNEVMEKKNEIVVYQPDETVRLEVRLEDETVWLAQSQMAELFGCTVRNVRLHLANIYKCGELNEAGTCSILEHMGHDGVQVRLHPFAAVTSGGGI